MSDRNRKRGTRKNRPRSSERGLVGVMPERRAAREQEERACAFFLELTDKSEAEFTVRVADVYIHGLGGVATVGIFPELEEVIAGYSRDPLNRHREHQAFLQRVLRRCEREIMNDPTVKYPSWRPHFSGKTGTMSQLLQNGFYVYYAKLLERGLEANLLADGLSLLTHLRYSADPALFTDAEKSAIQTILRYAEEAGLRSPSRDWWDEEIRYITEKKAIVESKEAWLALPPERKWFRFQGWGVSAKDLPPNRVPSQGIPKAEELGLPVNAIYDAYEYYPYTIKDTGVFEDDFQTYLQKLQTMRDLLAPPAGGKRRRVRKSRRSMK
jgi:hypothetical protein